MSEADEENSGSNDLNIRPRIFILIVTCNSYGWQ